MTTLTPQQCRAARSLLNWSQEELAAKSEVSRPTIAEFERGNRTPYAPNLRVITRAFEEAGVIFIAEDKESLGGGAGVRLRKPKP